jgi:nicotinamidase-related amidase
MRSLIFRDAAAKPLLICLDLQRNQARQEPVSWEESPRLGACARLLAHARRSGWSVVHAYRQPAGRSTTDTSPPIAGFEPRPDEPVFHRSEASALANPALAEIVLAARGSQILIAGYDLRTSGLATAVDAFNNGARMTFVRDAFWSSPSARFARGVVESVLWDVVSPFAEVDRVETVLAHTPAVRLASVANDF